jgi:hypothetical protein
VQRAEISVDSETGLPLKVEIFSTQQTTASMSVGFESIDFGPIDASLFDFTPPAGTEITTLKSGELSEYADKDTAALEAGLKAAIAESAKPKVIGENWQSVGYLPALPAGIPVGLVETELFGDMLTEVPGGKVFSTALVNVLLTDSGEIYMGAVTIEYLLSVSK